MDEKQYRDLLDQAFARIDAAFADVDPDLAEAQLSQGTLTILFPGGKRFIVSPQTPVRQVWVAFRDRAWHFSWDADAGQWLDDRGQQIELYSLVEATAREQTGIGLSIQREASLPRA